MLGSTAGIKETWRQSHSFVGMMNEPVYKIAAILKIYSEARENVTVYNVLYKKRG